MISDVNMLILCSSAASAATAAVCYAGQRFFGGSFEKGGMLPGPGVPVSETAVEVGPKSLDDAHIRERMTAFLEKHEITGDADVRDGRFYAPVPAERIGPLVQVLERAWGVLQQVRNRNACSLYYRDSVNDRWNLVPELDLDDIGECVRVMQRVAADRKKSRSLYKGVTDAEIRNFVSAGLSRWLKEHGEYDAADKVMAGDLGDFWRESLVARSVLELALQVKGADR